VRSRGLGGAAAHAGGKLGSLEIAHYAHEVFVQMLGTALSNPLLPSDVAAMDSTLAPEMAPDASYSAATAVPTAEDLVGAWQ
jgi:hypothetical protein